MLIPIMLNIKWQTAIWIALEDSVTSEAKKAVQVVPMFEPNVSGYICSTVNIDNPTNGVNVDVIIELDCTAIVSSIPTIIVIYGLRLSDLCTILITRPCPLLDRTRECSTFTI